MGSKRTVLLYLRSRGSQTATALMELTAQRHSNCVCLGEIEVQSYKPSPEKQKKCSKAKVLVARCKKTSQRKATASIGASFGLPENAWPRLFRLRLLQRHVAAALEGPGASRKLKREAKHA